MKEITKIYLKSAVWFLGPLIFTIVFCILIHNTKISAVIIFCYFVLFAINIKNLYYFIFGIPLISKQKKEKLKKELKNLIYDNNDVILTDSFVISCENLQIIEYEKILSIYSKTRLIIGKPMGIKGEIIITTKERKIKLPVASYGYIGLLKLGNDISKIMEIMVSKNPNILIGNTKENKLKLNQNK